MTLSTIAIWFLWLSLVFFTGLWLAVSIRSVAHAFFDVNPFRSFRNWPAYLLRRGYDGAYIVLSHKPTGRFIRFEKYIRSVGDYGIRLMFPETGWSEEYIPKLTAYCDANGLALSAPITGTKAQISFVPVDCGTEADRAWNLAEHIWIGLFGLRERTNCTHDSHDILEFEALVDDPAYPRPSRDETNKRIRQHLECKLGRPLRTYGRLILCALCAIIMFIVASIGLPAATLLSADDVPAWSISFGFFDLAGSSTSLAFWMAYLFSIPWLCRAFLPLGGPQPKRGRLRQAVRVATRFVTFALPIAVLLVWADA